MTLIEPKKQRNPKYAIALGLTLMAGSTIAAAYNVLGWTYLGAPKPVKGSIVVEYEAAINARQLMDAQRDFPGKAQVLAVMQTTLDDMVQSPELHTAMNNYGATAASYTEDAREYTNFSDQVGDATISFDLLGFAFAVGGMLAHARRQNLSRPKTSDLSARVLRNSGS